MRRSGPLMLLAVMTLGCGASGGTTDGGGAGGKPGDSGAGGCRANTPVGASVSWLEDGAAKCAVSVTAQRSTSPTFETLQLHGANLEGASVAFAVVAYGVPLEGTHACSTTNGGLIGTPGTVYVDFVHTGTKQSCSVTITNAGTPGVANASGTFSATFTGSAGAVVTSGVFDTPVKAPPTPGTKK